MTSPTATNSHDPEPAPQRAGLGAPASTGRKDDA